MKIRLATKYNIFFLTIVLLMAALSYLNGGSRMYSAAIIIISGIILLQFLASRFIKDPIARLMEATKAVGRGDLNYKLNITTDDEMGNLAEAFNQMTENLKEVMTSREELNAEISVRMKVEGKLRRHHQKLLEMVEERTINLQKVNEELEQEIKERTKAEMDTRLMALSAELNPSPVLRFDINGNIVIANNAASEILKDGNLIGKHLASVMPEMKGIDFGSCIRTGSIFSHAAHKGDHFYHFIFNGIPDMNFGQAYGSDITERKLAEAEAMRVGHLVSLGELAAGVAHEINNPINGIINFAQIIVNKSSIDRQDHDLAMRIIKEGDRIADIVKSLLSFASSGDRGKYPVPVSDIINDTLILTVKLLKKECIKLDIHLPAKLPMILANPQQIEQVLLNLTSNARYALNEKYPDSNPDKILEINCEKIIDNDKCFVRITFLDHGVGIPFDIADKILNPFFSSKPKDKGTGLGLSISHGIITDHEGRIGFESEMGSFTKVIVELPAVT